MPIKIRLNEIIHQRRLTSAEVARRVGITQANLSILKTGKAKAVRFSTLERICEVLHCKPGDILDFRQSPPDGTEID